MLHISSESETFSRKCLDTITRGFRKPLVMVSKHFLEKVSDSLEMCSMEISFLRWIYAEDLLSTLKSLENFSRLASGESCKQTYFSFQDTSDRLKKNHFLDSGFLII